MARIKNTIWNRYKYKINGLMLVLVCYFLYQSLFPQFPDAWETQAVGAFEITPMPYNLDPPYLHDGTYTKDFLLLFSQGQVNKIRQAYLNIENWQGQQQVISWKLPDAFYQSSN
jgi:hypothetical protein